MLSEVRMLPLGGLGNQLYLYGLALKLSHLHKLTINCDLEKLRNYTWHSYELDCFVNSITSYSNKEALEAVSEPQLLRKLRNFLKKDIVTNENSYVFKDEFGWQEAGLLAGLTSEVPNKCFEVVLDGYFQDFGPLSPIRNLLKKEVTNLREPSEWFLRTRSDLMKEDFIAVHVRLGNFKWVDEQNVVSNAYYERALDLARSLYGEMRILVFSDEPDLAREFPALSTLSRDCFVAPPENRSSHRHSSEALENMLLMGLASCTIIGNSTFGLWSAWLSERTGNRVFAPRPFSKKVLRDERFLVPEPWISLGY